VGITGTIDRTQTAKDKLWGMDVEIIASKEQCGSERLFYVVGTLPPGAQTDPIVHEGVEVAWYMTEGHTRCIIGDPAEDDYQSIECGTGSAGYIASGEVHIQHNLSDTDPATFLMAHVGINNIGAAQGLDLTPSTTLQNLINQH
jgi:uncharacterized RmlC-like cupin family protein